MDVLLKFAELHWIGWLGWALAGSLGWGATAVIAKPLTSFLSARMSALRAIDENWAVGTMSPEERVREAWKALREAAAKLNVYASGGGVADEV
jgi:hypothetical protein